MTIQQEAPHSRTGTSGTWSKGMPEQIGKRLAAEIIEGYGDLGAFDIDFMDEATSNSVSNALLALGCTVIRWPFKSAIHVVLPKE